jgi:hypothetical protein
VSSCHSQQWQGGWLFGIPFYAIIKGTLTEPAPISNLVLSFGWIFLILVAIVRMVRDTEFRNYARSHLVETIFLIPYLWTLYATIRTGLAATSRASRFPFSPSRCWRCIAGFPKTEECCGESPSSVRFWQLPQRSASLTWRKPCVAHSDFYFLCSNFTEAFTGLPSRFTVTSTTSPTLLLRNASVKS